MLNYVSTPSEDKKAGHMPDRCFTSLIWSQSNALYDEMVGE